jgi:two-component system, NarL family, response regulator NreC
MVRRVLIVDDNPVVRTAICQLFKQEPDFDVCGEAANGQEAIEKAQQLKPDLIVTDLSMPTMDGLEETRILKRLMPCVPIIIYTLHNSPSVDNELLSAGASVVISKSAASATLVTKARGCFERHVA